jgi:lysophospholipase L1-like esterase
MVAGLILFTSIRKARPRTDQVNQPVLNLTIEDPTGHAMTRFYSSLTATLSKSKDGGDSAVGVHGDRTASESPRDDHPPITRIVHYGDSHIAADILTGALRHHFADDFGTAGPGFILPGVTGYSRLGVESGSTSAWHVDGTGQIDAAGDCRFGLAGLALSTSLAGQRLWISADSNSFDLYLLKQPGGGDIEVSLDGTSQGIIPLKSDRPSPCYFTVASTAAGRHTVEIRTKAAGAVRVLGIAVEREGPGVVYDALGINGARATRPLSWNWSVLTSNLGRCHPDLIVLSYGTNEAGDQDLDFDSYRIRYAEMIGRFHSAAPDASILVIAPPDRARRTGDKWVSIQAMAGVVSAERQAALSTGTAFCDLYDEMGGAGSIQEWATTAYGLAAADRVHLTRSGYRLVADALYHGIEGAYLESVWRELGRVLVPFLDFKRLNPIQPRRAGRLRQGRL